MSLILYQSNMNYALFSKVHVKLYIAVIVGECLGRLCLGDYWLAANQAEN